METHTRTRRRSRQSRPAVEAMERRLALSAGVPIGITQVAAAVVIPAKKLPETLAWADGPVEAFPPVPIGGKQAPAVLTLAGKKIDPTAAASALCGSHPAHEDSPTAVASLGGLEKKAPTAAASALTGGPGAPSIFPQPYPSPPPGGNGN